MGYWFTVDIDGMNIGLATPDIAIAMEWANKSGNDKFDAVVWKRHKTEHNRIVAVRIDGQWSIYPV